ncbi:hypothetical protein CR513_19166, partial [Mucuna pruriens]
MEDLILQFQQNITATIQDLKIHMGQMANTVSQMELPQSVASLPTPQPIIVEVELGATDVPLPFLNRAAMAKRFEIDEDLLNLFRKVKINIPLLDAIKQIPKYAKFLKELCVHKRRKMKGTVEMGGVVSSLVQNEDTRSGIQRILPKTCSDPGIFGVPCIIGGKIFTNAILNLGASINVMPTSIYESLNLRDFEPTRMEVQLANQSVLRPLDVLEDILV